MGELLRLSTELTPTTKFYVDDEEYELLTMEHIGSEKEVELVALFHRFGRQLEALNAAKNDEQARQRAAKVRETRIEIITSFTTLPTEVASKLPLPAQNALLSAANKEMVASRAGIVTSPDDEEGDEDQSEDDD
jgi:hypothetical protein